jgi:hypothetical protein
MAGIILHIWQLFKDSTRNYWMEGGRGGEGGGKAQPQTTYFY